MGCAGNGFQYRRHALHRVGKRSIVLHLSRPIARCLPIQGVTGTTALPQGATRNTGRTWHSVPDAAHFTVLRELTGETAAGGTRSRAGTRLSVEGFVRALLLPLS